MKEKLIAIFKIILWVSLASYSIYLFATGKLVAGSQMISNMALIMTCFLGFFIALMGIKPICFSKMKIMQFVLGVVLVIGAQFLKDDPASYIYMADILKVLWVVMMIVGPLGVCIPQECKDLKEQQEVEIIEA